MFGLLKFAPSMVTDLKDFSVYRAHYCGLCHSLSLEYGQLSRFITNYEATLMHLLLSAIKQKKPTQHNVKCPVSVFRKEAFSHDDGSTAADISILLFNEKMLDDEFDEKKSLPAFLNKRLSLAARKAHERLREQGLDWTYIHTLMEKQRELEIHKIKTLEEISKPTALMMERIFDFLAMKSDHYGNKRAFRTIGHYLGKWIYLMDSLIDLEKDFILKRFNPILLKCDFTEQKVRINRIPPSMIFELKKLIFDCLQQINSAVNSLHVKRHHTLITDILTTGLQKKVDIVFDAIEKNSKKNRKRLKTLQASATGVLVPEVAFASNGSGQSCESCIGSLILCGIVFYGFRMMFGGCCGSSRGCVPCDKRPETVRVNSGCGGQKTYRKGCDGQYREESDCC